MPLQRRHMSVMASNDWQIDCLVNSLFRRTTNKTQKKTSLAFCVCVCVCAGELPTQRVGNTRSVFMSSHDVIKVVRVLFPVFDNAWLSGYDINGSWCGNQDISMYHDFQTFLNMPCHPGGHYWNYYYGALSLSRVTATHLKIRHP